MEIIKDRNGDYAYINKYGAIYLTGNYAGGLIRVIKRLIIHFYKCIKY